MLCEIVDKVYIYKKENVSHIGKLIHIIVKGHETLESIYNSSFIMCHFK